MNKKFFFSLIVVATFLTITINSCKEDDIAVTGVMLNHKTYSLAEGSLVVLEPVIIPKNASNKNRIWHSSDTEVATVQGGVVRAKLLGTARITVTTVIGGFTDYCDITVTRDVTGVELDQEEIGLPLGEELTLKATVLPVGATNQHVTWSTKDGGDGDVELTSDSLECKVKAKALGKVTIIVTTENGKTAECVIHVTAGRVSVSDITLNAETYSADLNESFILKATVMPVDATNKNVTWSCESEELVELKPKGLQCTVTAKAKGIVTITATTENNGKTASCEVNIVISGADFSKGTVYNFSGANKLEELYSAPTAARFASMNLDHVVISGRELLKPAGTNASTPCIFELNDLKKQDASKFTLMNTSGIWGGSSGARCNVVHLVHGHAYTCNMQPDLELARLRIYHWPDIFGPPVTEKPGWDNAACMTEFMVPKSLYPEGTDAGELRMGDSMSVDIDENGNGYIFLMGRRMLCVGRLSIANFNQITGTITFFRPGYQIPKDIPTVEGRRTPVGYHTFQRVDGAENEYLFTSSYEPVRLVDSNGEQLYTMTSFEGFDGCAARIIQFKDARYLVTMNDVRTAGKAVISIYDVTKGKTTREALEYFDKSSAENKAPKYTFSLEGNLVNDTGLAVSIDFAKDNDKLYIIGSAANTGFAIIEFPARTN